LNGKDSLVRLTGLFHCTIKKERDEGNSIRISATQAEIRLGFFPQNSQTCFRCWICLVFCDIYDLYGGTSLDCDVLVFISCSILRLQAYWRFGEIFCRHLHFNHEDRGNIFVWNVGMYLQDHTVRYPRRLQFVHGIFHSIIMICIQYNLLVCW
jgi:hypothetical protein